MYRFSICMVFFLLAAPLPAQESVELSTEELVTLESLAFEPFCKNPTSSSKVCIGEKLCKNGDKWAHPETDGSGNLSCAHLTNLGTNTWSIKKVAGMNQACAAALATAKDPAVCPNQNNDGCNPYCRQGDITPSPARANNCCTVIRTRTCSEVTPSKDPETEHDPETPAPIS